MAGHSHSSNVKYRKDRVNAAKAKAFSKVARMITVAAKLGGGDPEANPRLRLAVDKARMVSMPKDNIERAIKKGTGDGDLGDYEEILYEGYGPFGVAILLEVLTDNRNRTAPEVRKLFDRSGGNLGSTGAVAWMFERKAVFPVDASAGAEEEQLMEMVLDVGAEDLAALGDGDFEIHAAPSDFESVRKALAAAEAPVHGGEVRYMPTNEVDLSTADEARKLLNLIDALEDLDDVQNTYSNFRISDEIAAHLEEDS